VPVMRFTTTGPVRIFCDMKAVGGHRALDRRCQAAQARDRGQGSMVRSNSFGPLMISTRRWLSESCRVRDEESRVLARR
jgi:hypothetical protein